MVLQLREIPQFTLIRLAEFTLQPALRTPLIVPPPSAHAPRLRAARVDALGHRTSVHVREVLGPLIRVVVPAALDIERLGGPAGDVHAVVVAGADDGALD